jgi:hypothetical protein
LDIVFAGAEAEGRGEQKNIVLSCIVKVSKETY